jgi:hypothetical protein
MYTARACDNHEPYLKKTTTIGAEAQKFQLPCRLNAQQLEILVQTMEDSSEVEWSLLERVTKRSNKQSHKTFQQVRLMKQPIGEGTSLLLPQ